VALSGAVVVLRPWEQGEAARAMRGGDLWILAAVVSWAFYTVLVRDLVRRHDPRTIAAWNLILGSLAMMPFGAAALRSLDWHAISGAAWFGVAFMAVGRGVVRGRVHGGRDERAHEPALGRAAARAAAGRGDDLHERAAAGDRGAAGRAADAAPRVGDPVPRGAARRALLRGHGARLVR